MFLHQRRLGAAGSGLCVSSQSNPNRCVFLWERPCLAVRRPLGSYPSGLAQANRFGRQSQEAGSAFLNVAREGTVSGRSRSDGLIVAPEVEPFPQVRQHRHRHHRAAETDEPPRNHVRRRYGYTPELFEIHHHFLAIGKRRDVRIDSVGGVLHCRPTASLPIPSHRDGISGSGTVTCRFPLSNNSFVLHLVAD